MNNSSTASLLSESELLRRANLTHYRAGKLRAAGKLTPDQTAQGGRIRLYLPERVSEITTVSPTNQPKA